MVDRNCRDSVTKYFSLSPAALIPVVEEEFCEEDLENLKNHMVEYSNQDKKVLEAEFLELESKGLVINMWPEGDGPSAEYQPAFISTPRSALQVNLLVTGGLDERQCSFYKVLSSGSQVCYR